jgi:hypothetical protein
MKRIPKIKLVALDMKRCFNVQSEGSYHTHPDIKVGQKYQYLCLIDGRFYIGSFRKVWFGLNFDGWGGRSGLQLDAPGTNCSDWQQIWEIQKK